VSRFLTAFDFSVIYADVAVPARGRFFEIHFQKAARELAEDPPIGHDISDNVAISGWSDHRLTSRGKQYLDHEATDQTPP
jgi:hypothetical protein